MKTNGNGGYKDRQHYNKLLLEALSKIVSEYPDLRFNQILVNFNITPKDTTVFNEESSTTYKKMTESGMYYDYIKKN